MSSPIQFPRFCLLDPHGPVMGTAGEVGAMSEVEEMAIEERTEELEEPEKALAEGELAEPELEEAVEPEFKEPPKPSYFRLKIASAKEFANLLKAVAVLADEPTIIFTEDGLRIRSMDTSKIAMVDFFIGRSVFNEYEVDGSESRICVSLPDLLRLLRKVKKGETAELALDEATGRVKLTLRGKYTRSFTIPRLEFASEVPPELKLALTARAVLDANELKKAVEEVSLIGDFVKLTVDDNGLILDAESDVSSAKIEFSRACDATIDLEAKELTKAVYDAGYLAKLLKVRTALADVVEVRLAMDKPLKLEFKLPYDATLVYWLAPRVDVE